MLFGRYIDRTRNLRFVFLFNLAVIFVGNLMYSIPWHIWFVLTGRFLCGINESLQTAVCGKNFFISDQNSLFIKKLEIVGQDGDEEQKFWTQSIDKKGINIELYETKETVTNEPAGLLLGGRRIHRLGSRRRRTS